MLVLLLSGLAGLAALKHKGGGSGPMGAAAQDVVKEDGFFYGQSPPVYPAPEISGTGEWQDAYEKAKTMVGQMTLDEKVSLSGGVSGNGCDGRIGDVERLGFPGLCLCDAGQGLRNTDFVNSYPSGIHVGASWNKELARKRAVSMGGEFKTKGVNVLLGPVVGPSGRIQRGGRNWESISLDPYLSGALVFETVSGAQDAGVITSTKHFIANEQETNRNPTEEVEAVSSNIDDRTMHELYLWPFQDAVRAGTGSIMCSYNRLNNSYGCANSKSQNGLLKDELGFQGFIVSDWGAQHAGVATALAGLDMAMPSGSGFWEGKLTEAVKNGSVPESRLTDMATRIVASWYMMNQDKDFPKVGIGRVSDMRNPHPVVDARTAEAKPILFDGAVEGHVLVKNTNKALPLNKPRLISLFGYSAKASDVFNQNGGFFTDPFVLGSQPINMNEVFAGFSGLAHNASAIGINGTMISGGGSGATAPSLFISPFEAIKAKADDVGTAVFWDFVNSKPSVDYVSDACIVFGNAWASESYDRPGLDDEYTDELITHIASQCNNTIVVLHNAGIRLVEGFVDNPNVTALVFGHLPGQDSGKAVAAILFGDANPSGKLPYTVAKKAGDYGTADPDLPEGKFAKFPQSDFEEGVFVDYRKFDKEDIEPRYEFGFGLSYTSFEYSDLRVNASDPSPDEYPSGKIVQGGMEDLWDVLVTVSAGVKNTGDVAGAEVAQLYVGIPGEETPGKQLRGFEKPLLNATEEVTVNFGLTRRDLSIWDVERQLWRLQRGKYGVFVGGSSRDLPLKGEFEI